ncbi:porin [Shewanella profunda]|uniref:DcaP family trimeric outer membrane transporter n=1 Tax=Shewanella profunda TaxID=254793 RepID=UPI00200BCD2A|nr:DcaP family trimeric outer membrane transporter [Shewanella profunda]MCL1089058.1 porin [Shewanella profunda]
MKTLKTQFTTLALCCSATFLLAATQANAYDFEVNGTKLTVGGYAKLMMTYDHDGTVTAPYNGDLYSVYSTPIDGTSNAESSDLDMTARESRLFLKSSTETEYGTLTSHIEGDFFADIDADGPTWSNSNGFRIRHAYMKLQNGRSSVLAGQTWSNFMDFAGIMPSMDFSSDPGNPFVRQSQVKYQFDIQSGQYVSVSIENPALGMCTAGPATYVDCGSSNQDRLPDVVVKYFYGNELITFSPRAVLRRFEIDGQSAFGYGLAANASLKIGDEHKAVLGVMYGDGIGRYAGLGFNSGAGISDTGDIETLKYQSVTGGVIFALRPDLQLTVGAGYSEQDEDGYALGVLNPIANKTAFSWHSNVYWDITKDLQYAVGVMAGKVENMVGDEGDMTRFQTYIRYSF